MNNTHKTLCFACKGTGLLEAGPPKCNASMLMKKPNNWYRFFYCVLDKGHTGDHNTVLEDGYIKEVQEIGQ